MPATPGFSGTGNRGHCGHRDGGRSAYCQGPGAGAGSVRLRADKVSTADPRQECWVTPTGVEEGGQSLTWAGPSAAPDSPLSAYGESSAKQEQAACQLLVVAAPLQDRYALSVGKGRGSPGSAADPLLLQVAGVS